MCRCRQPQRQASTTTINNTQITTIPPSTSTSPTPTTPSPTPPPLPPVSFAYIKSNTNIQESQNQIRIPHYYYYEDSCSSSPSPTHAAATITAEALVHVSCSLPSLHQISSTSTPPPIKEIQTISPSTTLSRSLTMMPLELPTLHAKTQSVVEHCSCGLTFAVEQLLPISLDTETNKVAPVPLMLNEQTESAVDTIHYEPISNKPLPLIEAAHQHHSHHYGHRHYYNDSQGHAQNSKRFFEYETEINAFSLAQNQNQLFQATNNSHYRHHHHCQHSHHSPNVGQSFVQ